MADSVRIGARAVGAGHPCYVLAEAGVNHNGSWDLAVELVRAAKRAGADAVKFQTFRANRLITASAPKAAYQLRTTDGGESQTEMLRKLEMPEDWHPRLIKLCRDEGIEFLSTPYSFEDVDLLVSMGVGALKLASIHCAEPPFVAYAAKTGLPLILATGMATLAEVDAAVRAARSVGNEQVVLLQCTTDYPARLEDANARAIPVMRQAFQLPVGYSDHTESHIPCVASVALGACLVEKHLTLDRAMPGPDHAASFDPGQFAALVQAIRETERCLGNGIKQPCAVEVQNAKTMRRSLAARRDLLAGDVLDEADVALLRPASGLRPYLLPELLGRRLVRDVPAGTPFRLGDFDGE
ncbi:N-acetylneuraminate synthase family protein [Magnetospirillum aberrantis]|uniref:N-acetylneuraminate synthase n=1 Tax=Magnetospirillum aberrantis SpK TaxID=908842 RepID=A0A7C9QR43_9PROT|nr:N-acetylneuraminate synthase family protein [Magnetospirillum aberrantis]NFV78545.1 N-acetylneuraminate synthase [Magnetospirillum aberrantis SpK]